VANSYLRCDWYLEQTAAMVPPSVVIKDGMDGRRFARRGIQCSLGDSPIVRLMRSGGRVKEAGASLGACEMAGWAGFPGRPPRAPP
jgi:hypothetical protein